MNLLRILACACLVLVSANGAETVVYKTVADRQLKPLIDNGPGQWGHGRLGTRFMEFSPAHHVAKDAPLTIVFVGDRDKLISVDVMKGFDERMKQAGARCETHIHPEAGHGLFNKPEHCVVTLVEADKFLASLGWIQPRDAQTNRKRIQMTVGSLPATSSP